MSILCFILSSESRPHIPNCLDMPLPTVILDPKCTHHLSSFTLLPSAFFTPNSGSKSWLPFPPYFSFPITKGFQIIAIYLFNFAPHLQLILFGIIGISSQTYFGHNNMYVWWIYKLTYFSFCNTNSNIPYMLFCPLIFHSTKHIGIILGAVYSVSTLFMPPSHPFYGFTMIFI